MKYIFTTFYLICLVLVHMSLAAPVDVKSNSVQSNDPRFFIPTLNCVIQCVRPTGEESEDDSIETRGIIANYSELFNCFQVCLAS